MKQEIILDKIKHNDLMIEKYKKKCLKLNYVETLLILVSTVTVCILFSSICFIRLYSWWYFEFCSRSKYFEQSLQELESISQLFRKKKKKYDKIVLLGIEIITMMYIKEH